MKKLLAVFALILATGGCVEQEPLDIKTEMFMWLPRENVWEVTVRSPDEPPSYMTTNIIDLKYDGRWVSSTEIDPMAKNAVLMSAKPIWRLNPDSRQMVLCAPFEANLDLASEVPQDESGAYHCDNYGYMGNNEY